MRDSIRQLRHTRPENLDRLPGDPTPEEIAERAAEIRNEWSDERLQGRRGAYCKQVVRVSQ
jgi:hypothetical protein